MTNWTEITAIVLRVLGFALIMWGPNQEAFWVGVALVAGKDVKNLVNEISK